MLALRRGRKTLDVQTCCVIDRVEKAGPVLISPMTMVQMPRVDIGGGTCESLEHDFEDEKGSTSLDIRVDAPAT